MFQLSRILWMGAVEVSQNLRDLKILHNTCFGLSGVIVDFLNPKMCFLSLFLPQAAQLGIHSYKRKKVMLHHLEGPV